MRAGLVITLLFLATVAGARAAEWKQVAPGASNVVTAEAALGLTRIGNRLQVADGYSHFTEIVSLANRDADSAFLLIYQEAYPTHAFSSLPDLARLVGSLKLYRDKPYALGPEATSTNHLGVVQHVIVTTDGRECLLFVQGFGAPDQEFRGTSNFKRLIIGSYCPERSARLTPDVAMRALASYGIKGVAGPTLSR